MALATRGKRGGSMPDLLVRDVDPAMIERLKAQARRNGRSMQAEARAILEENVQVSMAEWLARAAELRKDDPPWQPGDPTSADLIREDREGRDARLFHVVSSEDPDGEPNDIDD